MRSVAAVRLRDDKEIDIRVLRNLRNLLMNKLDKSQIGVLFREFGIVGDD